MKKAEMIPVVMCWSGGKDSSMALRELLASPGYRVAGLLTTITEGPDRISMHGVRRELLDRQATELGLPLRTIGIREGADNAEYEARMGEALAAYAKDGIRHMAFGDLFLEDLRAYREKRLAEAGFTAVFPIWKRATREMAEQFIRLGFRAYVSCVDTRVMPDAFSGQLYDSTFLGRLPAGVDPCGENGEFHSFVFGGPIFRNEIKCRPAERVTRNGFCFCDLVPANEN